MPAIVLALVAPPEDGKPGAAPVAEPAPSKPAEPAKTLTNVGNQWRFAFSMAVYGFTGGWRVPFGAGVDLMFGAGYPVRSPANHRDEHAFGYIVDLGGGGGMTSEFLHRHRLGVSGVTGRRWQFYYQAGAGVASFNLTGSCSDCGVQRKFDIGPTVGARLGVARGYEASWIFSVGLDVDTFVLGSAYAAPIFNFSVFGFGRL